jgi:hypothetical protein
LSVADHAKLKVSRLTITDEPMICHTQGEQANYYTTDGPMICHTQGEQANYYTTDEPMICHTQGEQANYYTTDVIVSLLTLSVADHEFISNRAG